MGRRSLLANGSKTTRIEPSHLVHKNGCIKKPRELDMSQRVVIKPTSVYCRSPDDGGGTCKSTSAISEGRRTFMHLRPHKMYTPLIGLSRRRLKTGMNHAKASAADTHLSGRDSLSLQKMHPPASHAQSRSSGAQALKRVRNSETLLETSRTTTASSNSRKNHCKGKRSQHVKQATLTCHRAWQPPSYSRLLQTMGNHRLSVTLQPLPSRSDKQHVFEASNGKASRSADTDTEADGMKTKCQQIKVEPNINSNCAQWQTGKQRLATDMLPKNSLSRQNSQLKSKEESERTHKTAMLLRSNKKYVSVFQRKPRRSATARVSLGSIASDDQSSNCQLSFKDLQSSPSVERQTPEKHENVNEASAASLTSPEQCTTIQSPKCVLSNITPTFAMESKCNVEPTTQEVEQSSNRRVLNSGEERGSLAVLQNERGSSQGSQRIQQTDSGSLQSENKQSVMSTGDLQNTLENGQVDNEKSSVLPKSQVDHKQHSTHQKLDIGDISTHGEPEISKLGGSNFALRNLLTLRPYSSYRLMAGKQLLCATERRHWLLTQPGCRSLYHVDDYAPKVLMRLQPYTRYRRVVNKPQLHETKSRHWFLVQGVSVHSRQTMETIPDNLCKAQELSESLKSGTCSNLSNPNLPAENTPEEDLKAVESNEFEVDESPQSIKESGSEMVLVETSTPQLTKAGELDGSLSQETKLTTKHCTQKRSRQKRRKSAKNNCHAASKSFKGVKKEQSNTNHTSASKPCRSEQIIEAEENVSRQSCMAQNIASGQSCESPMFSTSIIDVPEIALSHNTGQRDEDADSHQAVSPAQDIVLTSTDASIQIKTKSVPDCNPKIRMMMRPYPAYQKVAGKSMLQCKFTGHWLLTEVQGIDFKHEKVDNMVRNAKQKSDSLLAIKAVESNEFEVDESPQNTNPNAPAGKTPEEVLLPVELSNPSEILLPQHIKAVESNEFEVNESPLNIKLSGSEKTLEETSAPQPTKAGELDGSLFQETELTTKPCTRKGSRQKRRKSAKNNHNAVSKSFKGVKKEQSITDHTSTSPKPCRSEEIIEAEENVSGQSSMAQNIVIGQSCESPTSMLSKSPIDVQEHSLSENSHQKDNDSDFLQAMSPAQDIAPSSTDASIQIKAQSVSDYSPKILMMMRPYPAYQKVAGNSMLPCKFTGHWFLTEVQGSDFKHEKVDDVVMNAEQKSDDHLAITAVESNEFEVDESPQSTNPNASVEKTPEEVLLPAELSNPLEMLLKPQHIKAVESNELEVDKSPQNTKQSGSEKALEETPVPQLTKAGELDGSLSPETKLTTKQCTQKGSSKKRRKSAKNKYHAASKSLNGVKKEQSIMDHTSKSPKSCRSEETVEAEKIVSGQSCMAQNIVSGQSCENPMLSKSVTHALSQNTRQRVKGADSLHLGKTVQTRSLTQKLERPKRRLKPTEKSLLHQLAKAVKTCRHSAKPTLKLKTVRKPTKNSPKPEFGKKSSKSKSKQRAVFATKILVPSRQSSGPDLRVAATCTEREPDSTHPSLLQETSDESVSVIQSQVGLSQGLGDCLKVNKVTGDKKATLAKQNRLHKVCLDIQVRGLSQLHHLISIANQISTMPSAIPDSDTTSGNDKLTTEEQCTDSEVVLDSKPQVVDTMQVDDTRESTCVTDVAVSSPCLSTMPSVISDSDTTLGNDNQTTEEQCTDSEAVLDSKPQAVDTMQVDNTNESTCTTDVTVSSPCLSTMPSAISDSDTTLGNDNQSTEEQYTDSEAVLDSKPQAVDSMQLDDTKESTCTTDATVNSPCLSTMQSAISDSDTTLGNDNQTTEEQDTDSEAVLDSKPQAVDSMQLDDTKESTCTTDVTVSSPCSSTMPSAISDSDTTSGSDNLTTEDQCTDSDSEAVLDSKPQSVDNMQVDDTKHSTCATDITVGSPCLSTMPSAISDSDTTSGNDNLTTEDQCTDSDSEALLDSKPQAVDNMQLDDKKQSTCATDVTVSSPCLSHLESELISVEDMISTTDGMQSHTEKDHNSMPEQEERQDESSRDILTEDAAHITIETNKCQSFADSPNPIISGKEEDKNKPRKGAFNFTKGSQAKPRRRTTMRLRKKDKHFLFSRLGFKKTKRRAFHVVHNNKHGRGRKPLTVRAGEKNICEQGKGLNEQGTEISQGILGDPGSSAPPSCTHRLRKRRANVFRLTHVMFAAASQKPSPSANPKTKPTIGRPRKLTHVMPSAALQKPSPSADPNTKSSRGRQRKPTHVMFAAASQKHSSISDPNTKPTIGRPPKLTHVMSAAASQKPSPSADPNTKPSIGRPRKLTPVMFAAASKKTSSIVDPNTKPSIGRPRKLTHVMSAAASQKPSSSANPKTKPTIGRPRKLTHVMPSAALQKPSPSADPNTKSSRGRQRKPTHVMFAAASQKHSSISDPKTKPTIGRPPKLTHVMSAAASQKPSPSADPNTKPSIGRPRKLTPVMFAAASKKTSSIVDPNTKPSIGRPRKLTHVMSAAASQKPSPSADLNTKSSRGRQRKPTHVMFAAASQKHSSIADPNTKPTIGRPRKLTDVMFAAASQKHSSIADPNTKPTIGRPQKQTHVMSAAASQKRSLSADPNTKSSRGRPRKPTHVMYASASQKHSSIVKPNTKPTIGRPRKLTHVMSAAASQKRSPSADPNTKSTIGRPQKLTHVMSAAASQKPLPSADPDTKSRRGRPWKPTHVMFAAASQKHSSIADPYTKPTRGRPRKPTDVMFAAASQKASPSADPNTKPTRSRPRKRKLSPHENSSPTNSILPSLHTCRRGKEFCTTELPSNVQLDLQHHRQQNSRSIKLQDKLDDANSDALSKPRGRKRKKRVFPKRKGDLQSPGTNLSRDAPPACMPASSPDHLPPAKRIQQLIPGYVSPDKEEFTLEEFCSLKTLEEAVEMAARETRNDELPHLSPVSRRKMKSSDSKLHGVSSSLNKKSRAKRSSRSPEGSYWDCSVCTYRNKAEAFKCAMCDVRKGTSTRKPRLNAQLVAQQQAQQNLSPLVHVKTVKPAPRSSPVQRKTGTPKKPRPRLKNIDRSSAISTEVVVNNVPVIITEYKEKSHTRTTVDSDEASADRTNGNVNGL